jgi:gamma-glutamylcyclotransferase (GGCT)/AIG2-like uncharacterized protein YtfP
MARETGLEAAASAVTRRGKLNKINARPCFLAQETDVTPMTHRVFVYGTLKRGFANNHYLQEAKFIGPSVTVPRYRMLLSAVPIFFPVLLPDPDGRQVAGEVYHVDDETLAALDGLERIATGAYTREVIEVSTEGGEGDVEPACIYIGGARWAQSGCPVYCRTNAAGALDWQR